MSLDFLEFTYPASAHAAVLAHPLLMQAGPKESSQYEYCYADTPDFALLRAGIALGSVAHDQQQFQFGYRLANGATMGLNHPPRTHKSPVSAFDDFSRELKVEFPEAWTVREQLSPFVCCPIQSLHFRTQPLPGVAILAVVEVIRIPYGKSTAEHHRLLLTLEKGSSIDLLNFAISLALELPLLPVRHSLFRRVMALHAPAHYLPTKFRTTSVETDCSPVDLFTALANLGVRNWQENVFGALIVGSPEFIHQFRVGLRRLRALLRLFKSQLPESYLADWNETIRFLANGAGEARDLDVLRETLLIPVYKTEPTAALARLITIAQNRSEKARTSASSSMSEMIHGTHILAFIKSFQSLPRIEHKASLKDFAREHLDKARRRAKRKLAAAKAEPSPENAHSLRIAIKNLRYSCDYLSPFLSNDLREYIKQLGTFQDQLGFLNDLSVASKVLASWAEGDQELLRAAANVIHWHRNNQTFSLQSALAELEPFLKKEQTPWRLASSESANT